MSEAFAPSSTSLSFDMTGALVALLIESIVHTTPPNRGVHTLDFG